MSKFIKNTKYYTEYHNLAVDKPIILFTTNANFND